MARRKQDSLAETALRAKALGVTSVERAEGGGTVVNIGGAGHNSTIGDARAGQLKSLVQRIERLEEDKRAVSGDIKEVYAEAKSAGYDARVLRKVVALRRRTLAERQEEEALTDLYLQAVGELA